MTRFPDDLQATISEVVASTTGRRSEGKPSVVCVSGGRGSGKNTHARVAANAILFAQGRVAVLDGDCANPLFGAPGVLTLSVFDEPIPAVGSNACFSERWLKRRAPLAAAFVGPTCARDNPAAYAASIERLIARVGAVPRAGLGRRGIPDLSGGELRGVVQRAGRGPGDEDNTAGGRRRTCCGSAPRGASTRKKTIRRVGRKTSV
jgi:polynucleotide 5'-kinase involved in rRNA processing